MGVTELVGTIWSDIFAIINSNFLFIIEFTIFDVDNIEENFVGDLRTSGGINDE